MVSGLTDRKKYPDTSGVRNLCRGSKFTLNLYQIMNQAQSYAANRDSATPATGTDRCNVPDIRLSYELADWLSDMPRIRQSKSFLRNWFMAFLQTDLGTELAKAEKADMMWFYEMLDEFLCDCLQNEAARTLTKEGGCDVY